MKIFIRVMLAVFLIAVLISNASCDNYVLPVPDGGTETPSSPSITGILKILTNNELHIFPDNMEQLKIIKYNSATQMFAEAGGIVWPDRLVIDGSIEIWYTRKTIKNDIYPPVAAVVRVPNRN
jgi:hypothetical protein